MPRGVLREHYQSKQHQYSLMNAILRMKLSLDPSHLTQDDIVHLQKINQSMDALSNSADLLSEDQQRIRAESINHHQALETSLEGFTGLRALNDKRTNLANEITTGYRAIDDDLQYVQEKINQTKATISDGTLLWCIDQFERVSG